MNRLLAKQLSLDSHPLQHAGWPVLYRFHHPDRKQADQHHVTAADRPKHFVPDQPDSKRQISPAENAFQYASVALAASHVVFRASSTQATARSVAQHQQA